MDRLKFVRGEENEGEKNREYSSRIRLWMGRHDDKEKLPPSGDKNDDYDIRLTPGGRKHAKEQSPLTEIEDVQQSVSFGSGRVRARETAALHMVGKQPEITGDENFEELEAKINESLKVGTKLGIDDRLDFYIDLNSEYGQKALKPFKEGRFFDFIINESDKLANELGDKQSTTYSRSAKNGAEIVAKYLKIAKPLDKLVNDKEKDYAPDLNRFFASHQAGTPESFLAKVIEETKGVEERDKFVKSLDNKGFDFSEGFYIDIITDFQGNTTLHITYKKEKDGEKNFEFDENVPINIIDSILGVEKEI